MDKLYIVVRSDISPGLQTAQACHALRLFAEENPGIDQDWYQGSNNLVVLQVPTKEELAKLAYECAKNRLAVSCFKEPDLGDELTAIALEPRASRHVRKLSLALAA